jgi:hypothetical protein
MIQNGINNWDNHKNDVLSLINTGKLVTVSAAPTTVPPTPVPRPPPPTPPPTIPIPPPTYRGPSPVVYASLNKTQTISQLQKLKNTLNIGQKYRTKKDKTKIITLLNKIEREIILDDDMMDEKIDNLIILLSEVEKTPNEPIKHATELQDF